LTENDAIIPENRPAAGTGAVGDASPPGAQPSAPLYPYGTTLKFRKQDFFPELAAAVNKKFGSRDTPSK
jgi:hypothetical protein